MLQLEVFASLPWRSIGARAMSTTWTALGTTRKEISLQFTLPTGQSFRWRRLGDDLFAGVIGRRVVSRGHERSTSHMALIVRWAARWTPLAAGSGQQLDLSVGSFGRTWGRELNACGCALLAPLCAMLPPC